MRGESLKRKRSRGIICHESVYDDAHHDGYAKAGDCTVGCGNFDDAEDNHYGSADDGPDLGQLQELMCHVYEVAILAL